MEQMSANDGQCSDVVLILSPSVSQLAEVFHQQFCICLYAGIVTLIGLSA